MATLWELHKSAVLKFNTIKLKDEQVTEYRKYINIPWLQINNHKNMRKRDRNDWHDLEYIISLGGRTHVKIDKKINAFSEISMLYT